MLANNGNNEGLFRGGFMESGSPVPVGDITTRQPSYDALVSETGCSGASDTLQCLREVPYDTLKAAVVSSASLTGYSVSNFTRYTGNSLSKSQQSLHIPWLPGVDGKFITDAPFNLVQQGKVAKVPFVNGVSFPHTSRNAS